MRAHDDPTVRSDDLAAAGAPADECSVEEWAAYARRAADPLRIVEAVTLGQSVGRVLARDVTAPEDIPAAPISAMDGFAVRVADLDADDPELPVAGDVPAAVGAVAPLPDGAAARIMTGAVVPAGADAVVEVERTDADPHGSAPASVRIRDAAAVARGRHIRSVGEEVTRGDVLAEAGDIIGAGLIGIAATLGICEVEVLAPVRVAVVVTGDELVDAEAAGGSEGAVRESNGVMLASLARSWGCTAEVIRTGDRIEELLEVLDAAARTHDLVITTGGIGHGAYDVVKAALGPAGRGSSAFAHVALRPGGPQGAGRLGPADAPIPVLHLPGTPVGALVGAHLFIWPLLDAAAPEPVTATLVPDPAAESGSPRRGRSLRPGTLVAAGRLGRSEEGELTVHMVAGSRLAGYGRADAMILQDGAQPPAEGGRVRVLPLS